METLSYAHDLDAINAYIMGSKIVTEQARILRDGWIAWFQDLGWYDRNFSDAVYDQARNRRTAFSRANTSTVEESKQVEKIIDSGLTHEEMLGKTRRKQSGGEYVPRKGALESATEFFTGKTDQYGNPTNEIPKVYKVAGILALLGIGGAYALTKIPTPGKMALSLVRTRR